MNATVNGRLPRGVLLDFAGEPIIPSSVRNIRNQFPIFPSGTGYGNYGANLSKNSLIGWLWRGGDADADIGLNVQILRERSRDAFMGIPLAAGAIETLDTNVVGEGLFAAPAPDAEALGISEQQATDLGKELYDLFESWACDPRECDFEARDTFYTKQHVAFQSMLLSGDCPVLMPLRARPGTTFELKLRILEADRVRDPFTFDPALNIFNGVELTNDGELVAYHISEVHPLAVLRFRFAFALTPGKTFRVEPYGALTGRRNMVLLMRPERPEQRRGVPILAVCLELVKQMGRYIDATVVSAVIQSYLTAFITSDFPDPNVFDSLLTDEQKAEISNINPYDVQLGPGIINFMRPGHEVKFSEPSQPQATFGEFTIAVAKFVGSATGIPYEVLLKQYNASYSASRAALLDFWKRVRKWRSLMVDGFCQPSYEEVVADAVALNLVKRFKGDIANPVIRRALCRCIWTGTSAGSLDPQKEVIAADLKVKCGFSTIAIEAAELNGTDYTDNVRQQAVEKKAFEDADLVFPPYRVAPSAATQGGQIPKSGESPQATLSRKRDKVSRVQLASGTSGRFIR